MGNEMGNNNTTTIQEGDNISEDNNDKNLLHDDSHADNVMEENHIPLSSIDKDVMENDSNSSNDITIQLGKDTSQEDGYADYVNGKSTQMENTRSMVENDSLEGDIHESEMNVENEMDLTTKLGEVSLHEDILGVEAKGTIRMIPIDEAKDVEEKTSGLIFNNTESMIENDSMEVDTNESDMNVENQIHPTDESDKATRLDSEDTTTELGDVSLHEEIQGVEAKGAKDTIRTIPVDEAKDVEEKDAGLIFNNSESILENDSLEGDTHESDMNVENQIHPTDEADKAIGLDSEDTTAELGDVSLHEEILGVEAKDTIRMIPIDEAKDVEEKTAKTAGLIFNNTESMIENDSLEVDTNESEIKMENEMHPIAEAEDVQDKATGLASEETTTELGEVSLQMTPTDEAKDTEEKATEILVENDSFVNELIDEAEMNVENQMHLIDEAEDVQEESTGMASDQRSSLENDLLKGKDDEEIAAKLGYDDNTSGHEGEQQEDKQDGNMEIHFITDMDVQGKTTILASGEPLNLRNSFGGEGEEMIGVRESEKSPYAESVEDTENYEGFSSSSLEGTEECGKQEDSCLIKDPSLTYDDHLNDKSSIKQDEEETMVLTLNSVHTSNDSELYESPSVLHDEVANIMSEHSLQDTFLDADSHFHLIKDDVPDGTDGNEFENGLTGTAEATSDLPSIVNNNNDNLLTKINYTTEDCLNPSPESFVADNSLKSDIIRHRLDTCVGYDTYQTDNEENFKVLDKENNLSIYGSTNKNPQDYKPDMVNNTHDMTVGSNGEKHIVLDQVEESNVTENGLQFEAYVNNFKKDPEEKVAVVLEAGAVSLIKGSTIADCMNGKGENHNNKMEDTKEESEASYTMNSDSDSSKLTVPSLDLVVEEAIEKEREDFSQHEEVTSLIVEELTTSGATISTEPCSSNSILTENSGYETRDIVTRLSIESNSDNPDISCQIQKSPSFNLNLRIETRLEESDQTENEILSRQTGINLSSSMPHAEYDKCMIHNDKMAVEEKIVTMERSYSEISKASFIGLLKQEKEEAHLLVMTQDNNADTKNDVKEVSPEGKERRKSRPYLFFSSCMCCATVAN